MAKFTDKDPLMVSIRCLTYNHEKYIRQTLDGFVMQKTNFRFEAVVHDDASTDGTAEIIREYAEKYPDIIKPIYETENQYSKHDGSLQNLMNAACKGKYTAWCEGDDWWSDPLKLQKQYDVMEAHPECSICVHKVACTNEDGSPNERVIPDDVYGLKPGVQNKEELARIMWNYLFQTSSYFMRRTVLDYATEHFDLLRSYNGDVRMMRSAFCLGAYYYIDEPMSVRRLGSINGWNDRQRTLPLKKRLSWLDSQTEADFLFSDYLGGQYTETIRRHWVRAVLFWSMRNPRWAKRWLVKHGVLWSDTVGLRKMFKIYYILLMHFYPLFCLWSLLKKLKAKCSRK